MLPPVLRPFGYRFAAQAVALAGMLLLAGLGETRAAKADMRELKREKLLEASGVKRDKESDSKVTKPRLDEATERGMARLREQLEVTDDVEWDIIGERITRLIEMRGSLGKGGPPGKGGPAMLEKSKKISRSGSSAHPEQEALRLAVKDKLPDAEIKARLDRAHEVQQQKEAQLARAQAELRAVLTVRQEAVAVLAGLLPP